MTGKNVTSTTIRTLGSRPNPNQITNSGAIATTGIVWLVTSSGSTARRTGSQRSSAMAAAMASTTDSAQPTSASTSVGMRWPTAASRKSHSAPTTRDGAGSVIGSIPARRTYPSQARTTIAARAIGGPQRPRRVGLTAGSRS